jgi:hypothetical protein
MHLGKLLEPSVELTQLQVETGLVCCTNSPDRAIHLNIISHFHVEYSNLQRLVALLIGKYLQTFRTGLLFQNSVCKQFSLGLGRTRHSHRSRLLINRPCIYREDFIHTAVTLDLSCTSSVYCRLLSKWFHSVSYPRGRRFKFVSRDKLFLWILRIPYDNAGAVCQVHRLLFFLPWVSYIINLSSYFFEDIHSRPLAVSLLWWIQCLKKFSTFLEKNLHPLTIKI